MSSSTRSFDRAEGSVVIISAIDDPNAFCSGFVLRKSHDGVVFVCPSQFIEHGRNRRHMLQVCFCDGKTLAADVLSEHGLFCLLSTNEKHDDSVSITWSGKESLHPNHVFTFVPKSATQNEQKDAYLAAESLKAFSWNAEKKVVENSDDYFMILCDHDLAKNAAVVFTRSGALGVIIQKCRETGPGAEMKVVLKASAVKRLLEHSSKTHEDVMEVD